MKKEKPLQEMRLWSCEKWTPEKCESVQPCQIFVPVKCREITGCPEGKKKGKWMRVPTSKLTI